MGSKAKKIIFWLAQLVLGGVIGFLFCIVAFFTIDVGLGYLFSQLISMTPIRPSAPYFSPIAMDAMWSTAKMPIFCLIGPIAAMVFASIFNNYSRPVSYGFALILLANCFGTLGAYLVAKGRAFPYPVFSGMLAEILSFAIASFISGIIGIYIAVLLIRCQSLNEQIIPQAEIEVGETDHE